MSPKLWLICGFMIKSHSNDCLDLCWKERNLKRVSLCYDVIRCDLDVRLKLSNVEGLKLLTEGEGK